MRLSILRRFGYYISIAALTGLTWLSSAPVGLSVPSNIVLAASDPVIAAAGDIACDPTSGSFNNGNGTSGSCRQKYTSDLLVNAALAAVLPLGDNQYYCGGYQAFLQSYDLSWGRVKSITHPVVGNHEYLTSGGTDCTITNEGASGYFNYFGSAAGSPSQGYYSYDIGTWHIVAINSNCSDAGGCGSTSPQGQWLAADLAAHQNFCTLAYWHIPLFSSGGRASSNTKSIWQTLYNYNADVVLSGHDHIYERFAPQAPDGTLDTVRGIREFIVGSGGANHTSLATIAANSEVRNTDTFGILKLTLHPTSYDWQFVPEAGKTFTDSGTGNCHGSTSNGTPSPTSSNMPTATLGPTLTSTATPSPTGTMTQTPTAGNTSTATPAGTTFTFTPVADAYIYQTNANTNYGAATTLQTDNSPVKHILLKFNVTGINGQQIQSAKLRLYDVDPSNKGGDFYRVSDNTWQENTVTWNNAPAADATLLGSLGSVSVNTWYEVDLSSLITSAGTYSLRIVSASSDGADYSSKEGANPPQLIVETQNAPTPSSTNPSTAAPTPTLTLTLTSTATSTIGPTFTSTSTRTATATQTFSAPAPTNTFTATATLMPAATLTFTATALASQTSTPIDTPTISETAASSPTAQGTDTLTLGPSPTGIETATSTMLAPSMTSTFTATATSLPSNTPTSTSTSQPSATPSPTATLVPSASSTSTVTVSPTATATKSPTPTATNTPAPLTVTFVPNADAYVNESNPTNNYGAGTSLRVDGSPILLSYLRFNVQGLSGRVTRATLRVYANSSSSRGYTVNAVADNSWSESTINYSNAPAIGSAINSSVAFSTGVWTTVDITSYVTGNGTFSLALTTSSSTAINLASRESGVNAPQLVVETIP